MQPTRLTLQASLTITSAEPGILDFFGLDEVEAGGFVGALLGGDLGHFAAAFPSAGNVIRWENAERPTSNAERPMQGSDSENSPAL